MQCNTTYIPSLLHFLCYRYKPGQKLKLILNSCYFLSRFTSITFSMFLQMEGNCTRMLRAILNKSWRQHPTRHQLYDHLPLITKTIQVRRTRHARHCWRSRDEFISDVLLWTPTYGQEKKQDDRHKHTFSNYVRIRDVVQKTCQRRWTIGKSGERGSGISVLPARHDDDDDDDIYIYI